MEGVATLGLDRHHLGPEIPEDLRGERTHHDRREVEHPDAVECARGQGLWVVLAGWVGVHGSAFGLRPSVTGLGCVDEPVAGILGQGPG